MLTLKKLWPLWLALCFAGQMHAQAMPPPNQLAFSQWIGTQLTAMVSQRIGLFVSEGQYELPFIMGVLLVYYLSIGLVSLHTRDELLIELVFNFMCAQMMLTFYDSPMPWGPGISFHELFSAEATWAASTLDMGIVNNVMAFGFDMLKNMERPTGVAILDYFNFCGFIFLLAIAWLFCSGITLIAHIALGFGALAGPLLIPFFIWPVMSWLFWGWIRFMVTYSLFIFSSSAIVYLYANCVMWFFTNIVATTKVNGVYQLGPLSGLLGPFLVLQLIFIIAFWQCHSWAKDLATGSASMGGGVSGAVQAVSMRLLSA